MALQKLDPLRYALSSAALRDAGVVTNMAERELMEQEIDMAIDEYVANREKNYKRDWMREKPKVVTRETLSNESPAQFPRKDKTDGSNPKLVQAQKEQHEWKGGNNGY